MCLRFVSPWQSSSHHFRKWNWRQWKRSIQARLTRMHPCRQSSCRRHCRPSVGRNLHLADRWPASLNSHLPPERCLRCRWPGCRVTGRGCKSFRCCPAEVQVKDQLCRFRTDHLRCFRSRRRESAIRQPLIPCCLRSDYVPLSAYLHADREHLRHLCCQQ